MSQSTNRNSAATASSSTAAAAAPNTSKARRKQRNEEVIVDDAELQELKERRGWTEWLSRHPNHYVGVGRGGHFVEDGERRPGELFDELTPVNTQYLGRLAVDLFHASGVISLKICEARMEGGALIENKNGIAIAQALISAPGARVVFGPKCTADLIPRRGSYFFAVLLPARVQ